MATCSNCGGAVSGDSAVCQSCGATVQRERTRGQPERTGRGESGGRPSPADSEEGWSRRDLLKYGGGGVVGLGALVLAVSGGGPAEVVRKYFGALDRGDTDTAEELTHEDGTPGLFTHAPTGDEDAALAVDDTRVTKNTGDEAVVETVLTVASMDSADRTTSTLEVALTAESGDWQILTIAYV